MTLSGQENRKQQHNAAIRIIMNWLRANPHRPLVDPFRAAATIEGGPKLLQTLLAPAADDEPALLFVIFDL